MDETPCPSVFLFSAKNITMNQEPKMGSSLPRAFQDTRPTFNHQVGRAHAAYQYHQDTKIQSHEVGRSFSNHSTDENSPALHDIYLKSESRVICMHRNVGAELGGEAIAAWWSFIRNLERETRDEAPLNQTSEFHSAKNDLSMEVSST